MEEPVVTTEVVDPDAAGTRVVDEQARRIGQHIRELRRGRSLTLVQLADRSGLSHSFLSQLERGHTRASMVSLDRIAGALGTSQVALLAAGDPQLREPDDPRPEVVRAHEGARSPFALGSARLLVHGGSHAFEPLEWIGANTDPGEHYEHHEDEFLTVVAGAVLLDLAGDVTRLGVGDSAYYRGGTPHRWCSADGERFHLIVVKQTPAPTGGAA
ncbi:XRE family transcriptional regulator [Curtobacterium sp. MCBD17_028]|nr:XRE family transcriptional regulator [Curtobacterium sp. MCBD17_028]